MKKKKTLIFICTKNILNFIFIFVQCVSTCVYNCVWEYRVSHRGIKIEEFI